MANTILGSKHQKRSFHGLGLLSLLVLIQRVGAAEFKVGGSKGWTVPTDTNATTYNQWAAMNRFRIGDSLLFVYPSDKDSVLRVNNEDYTNCNTARPIQVFKGSNTSFKFNQSGPYYFISEIEENCLKHEKMMVIVMADRSNLSSNRKEGVPTSPPPPPPSSVPIVPSPPSNETLTAPPPPTGAIAISPPPPANNTLPASPPPATETLPAPSPPGSDEFIPSPAPFTEGSLLPPSYPSEASSIFINFISSIGAFTCSSLLVIIY